MWSSSAFLCCEVVGPVQALLDVGVLLGLRATSMRCGSRSSVGGQAADVAVEGGGVHHRLALGRHGVDDRADVVDEAHVEHAVGLVEHQHLDVVEQRLARRRWSIRRPGVAIRMSSGPRSAASWAP